nr:MAG TPA: hypothetical protein [Caudoviricetes sp.]DAT52443.1 MAG TPA: hypothetical protein [Caudoviricetes sp.]
MIKGYSKTKMDIYRIWKYRITKNKITRFEVLFDD